MSRTHFTLALTGVAIAAAAAGCAAGVLMAPASGPETRRRFAWKLADERRALARACERAVERATTMAKKEIDRRMAACAEETEA